MSCIRKIQLGENKRATLDFFRIFLRFFSCKTFVLHHSFFLRFLSCSARQCRAEVSCICLAVQGNVVQRCLAFVLQFRKENIMSNNLTFRLDSETERMLNELVTYYLGVGTLGGTNKLSVEEEKALN